ncbi:MAG: amidohydrolase family protein [Acidobacteria bacterium]|nr:amidohydrolase family protein [Acidobacteriota bacterium]
MKKKLFSSVFDLFIVGICLYLGVQQVAAAPLEADMIILNGKILTADTPDPDSFRTAQAAAIFDGRFVAVGSNQEVLEYAGPTTQRIDLAGRTVLPGLVETHNHIYSYGDHWFPEGMSLYGDTDPSVRLSWSTKEDFLAQIRTQALKRSPGEWLIFGSGGATQALQDGAVTPADLDTVAPNNPVVLYWGGGGSGGTSVVNSKTLELLLARYPDIPGLYKDDAGKPTGLLAGVAHWTLTYEFYPMLAPETLGPYYKKEMEEMTAQGITTVSTRLHPQHLAAYGWLHQRKEAPVRMGFSLETTNRNANLESHMPRLVGIQGGEGKNMWGLGDDKLWVIGLALSNIDETPGSGGSCVNKPYPREAINFPAWRNLPYGPLGLCTLESPDYNDIDVLRLAAKYGFRISAMHSGGDRGIESYLDAVEDLVKQYPEVAQRRWAIDHCRYINDAHAARAQKLGTIFSCGPKYVHPGDKGDIGAYSILYGPEIAADVVVPLRRLIDHNLRTTMQIDQHGFHAFLALEVAHTRKDATGKVWGPQQRISRKEALYTYTRWSSEYVLKEDVLGSIEPGKYADFTVLDKDYLTVPEDEIGMIDPVLTVMGGKIVHTQQEFATRLNLPQVGFRGNPTWWRRGGPDEAR